MDVTTLQATTILSIPLTEPERLFSGEADKAKREYRELVQKWHPDRNPTVNGDVIAHINKLFDKAQEKLAAGLWHVPGLLTLTTTVGTTYQLRYKHTRPFELGEVYIGDRIVAYALRKDYSDLAANAKSIISAFRFANDEMRAEARRYLPQWQDQVETKDRILVVFQKEADYLCLRDVLEYMGTFDPRHVAWVMSRLHNLLCYLEWAGIAHNDISLDSYFISPGDHSGCLIGGWWYAAREGQKMLALPDRTLRLAPAAIVLNKKANRRIDSELVRAVGRELLGDTTGTGSKLLMTKDVPQAMIDWLRMPGSRKAVEEYDTWYNKVLSKAFGPRRFVRMEVPSGLYDKRD